MELLNDLLKDKKTVIIMAIIYVIVMVVALIIIWKPDKVLEISKYSPYDEEKAAQEMAEIYFASVTDIGVYGSKSYLQELLDTDYLEYSNTTVEEVLEKLKPSGKYPSVNEVNVINVDNKVIYSGVVDTGENKVTVNVIENYPYNIRLTLDNFYEYNKLNREAEHDGVLFTIKSEYRDLEYIKYDLEVQNNTESYVNIDLSVATQIFLKLEDGTKVYIKNPYTTPTFENMQSGGIGTRDIIFSINVVQQNDIESLNFTKVNIGGEIAEVKILL